MNKWCSKNSDLYRNILVFIKYEVVKSRNLFRYKLESAKCKGKNKLESIIEVDKTYIENFHLCYHIFCF